jgi:hypothetical protein
MNFEDIVTRRVLAELSVFDKANLKDPSVSTAMSSITMIALTDIQDDYPQVDAKAVFTYDPEVCVEITWWEGVQGRQNKFAVKFNPLRIAKDKKDLYSAYDHAMGIL